MNAYANQRSFGLLTAPAPIPAAVTTRADRRFLLAADARWLPQGHWVQATAEPAVADLVRVLVSAEAAGLAGCIDADAKTSGMRMDVRGVPPRGKPV